MKRSRIALIGGLTATLIVFGAGPAAADVTKSGSKHCSNPTPQSWLKSYTSGHSHGYAPGGVGFDHIDGTMTHHFDYGTIGGGSWKVTVSGGSLNDAETYAGCTLASPI